MQSYRNLRYLLKNDPLFFSIPNDVSVKTFSSFCEVYKNLNSNQLTISFSFSKKSFNFLSSFLKLWYVLFFSSVKTEKTYQTFLVKDFFLLCFAFLFHFFPIFLLVFFLNYLFAFVFDYFDQIIFFSSFLSKNIRSWIGFFFFNSFEMFLILTAFSLWKQYPFEKFFRSSWILKLLPLSASSRRSLFCGFGCALPAYLLSNQIQHPKEKRFIQFILPFVNCSGRLPSLLFVLSSFFISKRFWESFFLTSSLLMFVYFINGLLILVSYYFFYLIGFLPRKHELIQNLPSNKKREIIIPSLFFAFKESFRQIKSFFSALWKPFLIVLCLFFFIEWGIGFLPQTTKDFLWNPFLNFFVLTGLKPEALTILLSGFVSREVMAMMIQSFLSQLNSNASLFQVWGVSTVLIFLVWLIYTPHCLPTFLMLYRSSKSWVFSVGAFFFMLIFTLMTSTCILVLSSWFGL
jgi:hypothetical protein